MLKWWKGEAVPCGLFSEVSRLTHEGSVCGSGGEPVEDGGSRCPLFRTPGLWDKFPMGYRFFPSFKSVDPLGKVLGDSDFQRRKGGSMTYGGQSWEEGELRGISHLSALSTSLFSSIAQRRSLRPLIFGIS